MSDFVERIVAEYRAGTAHVFLLHFNVWDIAYDDVYGYLPMSYYLMEQLNILSCDLVLGYSPTMGFHWPRTAEVQQNIMRHLGLAPHRHEIWAADVASERPIGRINEQGVFQAQHVGRGRVQVRTGQIAAQTDPILVEAPELQEIRIEPREATISSGKQQRFVAIGRDARDQEVYLQTARWEILPEQLFRLDASLAGHLKRGAVADPIRQVFQQNRHPLTDRAMISIEREGAIWRITDESQTYTLFLRGGHLEVQIGDIGSIDSQGVFRATKTGRGKFRVQAGGCTAESGPISVVPGELVSLELEPRRSRLHPGDQVEFQIWGQDAAKNEIIPRGLQWEVTSAASSPPLRRRINSGVRTDKWWEDDLFKWKQPQDVRGRLDALLRSDNARVGLVIDFLEELAPNGEISQLTADQRYYIEDFQRWAMDLDIRLKRNAILLLARNLNDVSPALTMNGDILVLEVPFPNYQERLALIRHLLSLPLQQRPPERSQVVTRIRLTEGFSPEQFASTSAGLNLLGIHDVALRAEQYNQPITSELVDQYKRESMRVHSRGLLDVVNTEFGAEFVGGMQHVSNFLPQIVRAIHQKQSQLVPTGILFLGPPGTGKTFVAQVLARQGSMAFVQLKNTRETAIGIQSGVPGDEEKVYVENITMALSYVRALAPVAVFMDEIDHAAGFRSDFDVRRTDSMLPIELINTISDPSLRGQILWIGASNRPDLLDPLFRRRGLFDDRLIFLLPTAAERADILQKVLRKHQIPLQGSVQFDQLTRDEMMRHLSGGDIEVIALRSLRIAQRQGHNRVSQQDILHAVQDFSPEYAPEMLEYMSLLAMRETTSREMLPVQLLPEYAGYVQNQKLNKTQINQRIQELKKALSL